MELDWKQLSELGEGIGKDFLEVVKPYLPVLARSGHEVFEGFVRHLNDKDFTSIDRELYALMTQEERRKLEEDVLSDAYKAALSKFERKELFKEIAQKMLIRIAIKVATGGIL